MKSFNLLLNHILEGIVDQKPDLGDDQRQDWSWTRTKQHASPAIE